MKHVSGALKYNCRKLELGDTLAQEILHWTLQGA